jgi:hypothetical protein
MNTTRIKKLLSQIPGDFLVCASDRLPAWPVSTTTVAIVANTVAHTERGEHWVAFYVDGRSGVIEYFDSYGRPPYQPDYQRFLRRNKLRYVYNGYRLQGYGTSVCGHYCLTYLYCRRVLGMTLNDYVQLFDPAAPSTNDVLVRWLFDAFFRTAS